MIRNLLPIFLALPLLGGCAYSRSTTTDKTAIEGALMSHTLAPNIDALDFSRHAGKSFALIDTELVSPAKEYILSRTREHLLSQGLTLAKSADEADLLISLRAEYSGIDDREFLIGIPSIPIPAGVATLQTPEIALYKESKQVGRNRVSAFALDRESRALAGQMSPDPVEHHYTRYTILFIIGFRTTDLPEPF